MPSGTRTSGAGRHECGVENGLGSRDGLRLDRRLDHGLDLADLLDLTDVHGGLQVVFRGRSQEVRGERSLSSDRGLPGPAEGHTCNMAPRQRPQPAAGRGASVADLMDAVISLAKRRGIAFQSSEIYGGLRSSWDYGPLGVELRRNIRHAWWRSMVQLRDDVVGLEAAIMMSPRVWEASGHVAGFSDPLVECLNCHQRFRADHLPGFHAPHSGDEEWFGYWVSQRLQWYVDLGVRKENLRLRPHEPDELAHYAKAATDVEYEFPFGWSELEGIANRTDFDLRQHQEASGEDLTYYDQENDRRYLPFVIEPAVGVDRILLVALLDAHTVDQAPSAKGEMEKRTLLKLHPDLAPV